MKMSDVFTGGKVVEIGGYYDNDAYINTEEHGFGTDEEGVAEAAIHAINNHDALVEALEAALEIADDHPGIPNLYELHKTLEKAKGES